ncbi:MAG: hypothetical protein VYE73_18845 [Acidobacteriota bacterium]|nr:hypothetical protein [Acidobacteriota bacterium]
MTGAKRPSPSLARIMVTDGHVALLVVGAFFLSLCLALLFSIAEYDVTRTSAAARLAIVFTPFGLLMLASVVWALSIRRTLETGRICRGRLVGRRVDLRSLLVLDFEYELDGKKMRAASRVTPQTQAGIPRVGDEMVVICGFSGVFTMPVLASVYE